MCDYMIRIIVNGKVEYHKVKAHNRLEVYEIAKEYIKSLKNATDKLEARISGVMLINYIGDNPIEDKTIYEIEKKAHLILNDIAYLAKQ